MKKWFKNLSHVQIIALGYLLIILLGTCLLLLPFATKSGESCTPLQALFTSTSASCVTGLVLVDTFTSWSIFGQIVILSLIQIGGLGFMTIATLFFLLFRKKMGLRQKEVMIESINTSHIGGIMKLARRITLATLSFEGIGAVILSLRFILHYHFSIPKGIYYGVFHSVSAFCNAGFDLNGSFSSFVNFAGDITINLVLSALILIGGLGFLVWDDLAKCRFRFKRLKLHSKIVLAVTFVLTLFGTVLFFIFEQTATGKDLTLKDQILTAFFSSVTPRTAGFNTVDTASLSPASTILTIIYMFIGGSPGSTAGGAKTTTLAVLAIYCAATLKKSRDAGIFGRQIPTSAVQKAIYVCFIHLAFALTGTILICAIQPELGITDVVFEIFSAINTVGMTTGITRSLSSVPAVIIALLMYMGRIGSVSFGAALMEKKAPPPIIAPHEDVMIG